nr:ATPase [Deinococcus maricopensis]
MNAVPLSDLHPPEAAPSGALPLALAPLIVLVGVTGVGKSTTLAALRDAGLHLLPDRRDLTDTAIITPLAGRRVTDREERFALTARYRALHPGGMAHALGSLHASEHLARTALVFDGLRGLDEVQHASSAFPAWRFVNLDAPDLVRVRRLLGRADAFDRVSSSHADHDLAAQLRALNGIEGVFTPADLEALTALPNEGFAPQDVLAKARVVVSERQQYDPSAALTHLRTLPRERALLLDTVRLTPEQVAAEVRAWL